MHALISGASVAGPVLAHWLRRHGWRVTVVERTATARVGDGGHAVDLFGPAVDVIQRMGLLERVTAASTRNDSMSLYRPGGGKPVRLATSELVAGVADKHVEIMRGELAGIVHEATRDDVDYRFGTMISALDGTTATLSDGSTVAADLVVGADGLHSGVRSLVFGPERQYRHFLGAYLAVFSVPDIFGTAPTVTAFAAPDLAVTAYPTLVPGRTRVLVLIRSAASVDRDRAGLRALIGPAPDPHVARILEHLDAADDFYFDDISQIRMDTWSRGRVTLAGDAGYSPGPAVGGGTSLAVAGAFLLASHLGTGGDIPAALSRYEDALREPVRHAQRIGPAVLNTIVPRNGAQVWASAQVMRVLPRLPGPVRRRLTSFGGGPAAMLDGLALPA
ncbi:FAD-dependent monooxygenase [Virgisporangium aliadipatigenens]|uniref:FAD-dependent monooxygenase n=1 Tax=Virgisporangium aliadipatigenens TaxID=741659 RepID=UPI0019413927|nr:FAD-dependent monooxygenase [Virgisporangium aliadipatigenens]